MQPVPVSDKRLAERFGLALPITLEGEEGATHDLSASGVLFESSYAPEIGAQVDLNLQYLVDGHHFNLACRGEVVRVERHGDNFNIAVHLSPPLFTELDDGPVPT